MNESANGAAKMGKLDPPHGFAAAAFYENQGRAREIGAS